MGDGFAIVDGVAPSTRRMRKQIDRAVRGGQSSVLITGPTGAGKELVAREIHRRSRGGRPYVAVNVGAQSANLLQSALFGHERGSFTGAETRQTGYFHEAAGGTLCLDELGELPLSLQPVLLRVVEQGEYRPVGAARDVRVEARLLASTNRDLRAESAAGQFRQDLFYRLAQHEVQVPALDERRDDFRAIASSLVPSLEFSEDAWRWLERRSYPGNVRELSTILLRMKSHCDAEKRTHVDRDVLRELEDHTPPVDKATALAEHALRFGATLAELRRAQRFYAELGRAKADGNVSRAARELGVSRGGLRSTLATKKD